MGAAPKLCDINCTVLSFLAVVAFSITGLDAGCLLLVFSSRPLIPVSFPSLATTVQGSMTTNCESFSTACDGSGIGVQAAVWEAA